jgi:hypothetical protein
MTADWIQLRNDELCDLYISSVVIRMIKSVGRVITWEGEEI